MSQDYHPAGSCGMCAEPPDFSLYEPCPCPCHGLTYSGVCGTCCAGEERGTEAGS